MAHGRQARLKCPTREEIDQLLLECRPDTYPGARDYTMIQLVINTGISPADLSSLQVDDVTEDGLTLARGLYLPLIGTRIRTVLGTYLDIRRDMWSEHHILFLNSQTVAPLTSREIGHIIARRCRQSCLDLHHPYNSLRYYFVQRWLKQGGAPEDLKVIFADPLGKRRLPRMISPASRLPAKQARLRRRAQLKDQVVRSYVQQGMSFKTIYAEYGVTEKMARECLKMAGHKARNASQAAHLRYSKHPDSSPVGKRLARQGLRAWQQEQRLGTDVLKLLADKGRTTLAELVSIGMSRRQITHARRWLVTMGFAAYWRSSSGCLEITEKGMEHHRRVQAVGIERDEMTRG